MNKKFPAVLMLLFLCISLYAGNIGFVFEDLDQHPELLAGFLPTLVEAGASYNGFNFIEDETTKLIFTAGGGLSQRVVYQDPLTGEPLTENVQVYDVVQARWNLCLSQTFKKYFTVKAAYNGRFELAKDSLLLEGGGIPKPSEISRRRGAKEKTDVASFDKWFSKETGGKTTRNTTPVYPDFHEGNNFFNILSAEIRYDRMTDTMVTNNGWYTELKLETALPFLNREAAFFGIMLNTVGGVTLYELQNKTGKNLFSVVVLDRINASWADGSAFPVFSQTKYSLGRKMRAFNGNSYNSNFSIVNNLDIRLAGPELFTAGIFPRINLFFDAGFGAGNLFNTGHNGVKAVESTAFLVSNGVQIEMSFFDMIDLGIEIAYTIKGENKRNPSSNVQMGATFFLDF